ncbi:MAG: hypothetical protein Q7S75_02730 [bacterium]|nr:hypothetical protein [bacterium]
MNDNKSVWIVLGIGVLLLGGFGAAYFYLVKSSNQPPLLAIQTLRSENKNYREADVLFSSRQYSQAIVKYTEALQGVDSLSQEILIKFKIAEATRYIGDYLKAIDLFKDIIDNPRYTSDDQEIKQGKASAVVSLTAIFYQTQDKKVTEKIFSGRPYEDFITKEDADNIDNAYRRLFEYASSLSSPPNLLSEARIAAWYALQIYDLKKKKTINDAEKQKVQEYDAIVKSKLAYIRENSSDVRNYYEGSREKVLPLLLRSEGIIVGALTIGGDTSLGDPEKIFQEALALPQPEWDRAVTEESYAIFLAGYYGDKRKDDIDFLLASFYSPPTGTELSLQTLLLNEKTNPTRGRENFLLLASADPKFKDLLISLGWKL